MKAGSVSAGSSTWMYTRQQCEGARGFFYCTVHVNEMEFIQRGELPLCVMCGARCSQGGTEQVPLPLGAATGRPPACTDSHSAMNTVDLYE